MYSIVLSIPIPTPNNDHDRDCDRDLFGDSTATFHLSHIKLTTSNMSNSIIGSRLHLMFYLILI